MRLVWWVVLTTAVVGFAVLGPATYHGRSLRHTFSRSNRVLPSLRLVSSPSSSSLSSSSSPLSSSPSSPLSSSLSSSSSSSKPCPKVYKYALPQEWLDARIIKDRGHADPPYPDPFGGDLDIESPQKGYHATKHKSAPPIFERLLDNYGDLCSTDDPQDADLFFIPWYRDWFCGVRRCDHFSKESPEEEMLFEYIQHDMETKHGVNFFTRNFGHDHFMLAGTMSAINLVPKRMKYALGPYRNVTTFSSVGGSFGYFPFATFVRYQPGMSLSSLPWSANATSDPMKSREHLVFMAWGSLTGPRGKLTKQCEHAGEDDCLSLVTTRKEVYTRKDNDTFQKIVLGYASAIFCPQLGVETCSRKGILDAIVLGCIVVFFSPCPIQFYNDYIDMRRVTIHLHKKYAESSLISRLKEIPPEQIRDMQIEIAKNAHRLQFSKIDSPEQYNNLSDVEKHLVHDDAFFTLLRVAERIKHRRVQCEDTYNGHYQPRFGVCCPRTDEPTDCNPYAIIASGVASSCEGSKTPPCYFNEARLFDMWSEDVHRKIDPIDRKDFLRGPVPFKEQTVFPPMTKNSTW